MFLNFEPPSFSKTGMVGHTGTAGYNASFGRPLLTLIIMIIKKGSTFLKDFIMGRKR